MVSNGELLTAEEQALEGLESLLSQAEADLAGPIQTLIACVQSEIASNEQHLEKCRRKLKAVLGRNVAQADNSLDAVTTKVTGQCQGHVTTNEITLNQLAVKGGVIQVGDSLDDWVNPPCEPEPVIQWGGTLVLSVREAIPHLDQLIEVLKEIRDRLPGQPVEQPGELPAAELPSEVKSMLDTPSFEPGSLPEDAEGL